MSDRSDPVIAAAEDRAHRDVLVGIENLRHDLRIAPEYERYANENGRGFHTVAVAGPMRGALKRLEALHDPGEGPCKTTPAEPTSRPSTTMSPSE